MSKKLEINNITLPVYEVCHKELEDKAKDIEDVVIPGAIAADKDILSQIVYDTTDDTAIFPKDIVPLKIWDESLENYVYFDYINSCLVREDNQVIENSSLTLLTDGRIKYDNGAVPPIISELVYINYNGVNSLDDTLNFNTYFIFNPITSAGTKLYNHHFDLVLGHAEDSSITQGNLVHVQCNVISTDKNPWTRITQLDGYIASAFGANVGMLTAYQFNIFAVVGGFSAFFFYKSTYPTGNVTTLATQTIGDGQSPADYVLQDSVTEL